MLGYLGKNSAYSEKKEPTVDGGSKDKKTRVYLQKLGYLADLAT